MTGSVAPRTESVAPSTGSSELQEEQRTTIVAWVGWGGRRSRVGWMVSSAAARVGRAERGGVRREGGWQRQWAGGRARWGRSGGGVCGQAGGGGGVWRREKWALGPGSARVS